MRKIIALLLVTVMCFAFVACGNNEPQTDNGVSQQQSKPTENNSAKDETDLNSQDVTDTEDTNTDSDLDANMQPVVSDEEMVGIWLSEDNVSFEIKADGTIINKNRDQNITFSQDGKYVPWRIEGSNFIFQEAMGSILKFEIIKDNDLLKLKYLEMDGAFVYGIMVEEFMTELTRQS